MTGHVVVTGGASGIGVSVVERLRAAVEARTPLGRLCAPQEMAREIVHLLLDATFATGVCVPVDGGWTAVGK